MQYYYRFGMFHERFLFIELPVVSREWLSACYEAKKRVPMKNFLIGESFAPADDVTEDDDTIQTNTSATLVDDDAGPSGNAGSDAGTSYRPVLYI